MKKIFKKLTVVLLTFAILFLLKISFIHTVKFVPLVKFDDLRCDFLAEESLVTSWRYAGLKLIYPEITLVRENMLVQAIASGNVALLPWWYVEKEYKPLRVEGNYFYDDDSNCVSSFVLGRNVSFFERKQVLKLSAGGTVVLARGIGRSIDNYGDPTIMWEGTRHVLENDDQAIVNFKSPLVYDYTTPNSRWLLRGKQEYADGLSYAGVDIVSLSGNHMGDAGREGLLETIAILKEAGVNQAGAGRNQKEAYAPYVWEQNGFKFAFLAFNSVIGSAGKAMVGTPSVENTGIAWLDEDALAAVASANIFADVVIVLANWGEEYSAKPTLSEIIWGHKLVDAGADIVIGDQAHWVQNYEFYKNKYIAYGLGNYIFDQYWSEKTKEGIIQRYIFYNQELISIETIPIKLFWHGKVNVVEDKDTYTTIMKQFYGTINL